METDSFETDLRQILARHAAEVPGEAVERLQQLRYRPRTPGRVRMASAGLAGAGLAGAAAILGLAMSSQPASHQSGDQASPQGSARGSAPGGAKLAAWTVAKQADGTVTITVRELLGPAALQHKIRAAGVPASVSTSGNPACKAWAVKATALALDPLDPKVHTGHLKGTTFVLHSSSLPKGAGIELIDRAPGVVIGVLVRASKQCTGS